MEVRALCTRILEVFHRHSYIGLHLENGCHATFFHVIYQASSSPLSIIKSSIVFEMRGSPLLVACSKVMSNRWASPRVLGWARFCRGFYDGWRSGYFVGRVVECNFAIFWACRSLRRSWRSSMDSACPATLYEPVASTFPNNIASQIAFSGSAAVLTSIRILRAFAS